jgi:hypothetical protein
MRLPSYWALVVLAGCARDPRDVNAARSEPARDPAALSARSVALCALVGPNSDTPGIYGTDLGHTVTDPTDSNSIDMLFGDTWSKRGSCKYPMLQSDDLQASLPLQRPSDLSDGRFDETNAPATRACRTLEVPVKDARDATTWDRIRLFSKPDAATTDTPIDTGALRTPVAAFSDGEHVFAMYARNDFAYCKTTSECVGGTACTTDPGYAGKRLGACTRVHASGDDAVPTYCRDVTDCDPGMQCGTTTRGVCVATNPFELRTPAGNLTPSWYRDDPRLGIARVMYLAARIWPDRPADYAVVDRFITNRFVNVATRTVRNFDPDHPERNDYRPGSQTLLMWGRAQYFALGGVQHLPFFLYASLGDLHGDPKRVRFRPHFFAGYSNSGAPTWSERESDALPIYGTETRRNATARGGVEWAEPEFDYVNQMAVSYVAPLGRFVMLYGGDVPAFGVRDPNNGSVPDPVNRAPVAGAIHLRTATAPWGRPTLAARADAAWSSPLPILTRTEMAPYLSCGTGGDKELPGCMKDPTAVDPVSKEKPSTSLAGSLGVAASCAAGQLALSAQNGISGNPIGRMYGANIIDEWTTDVTATTRGLRNGDRAAGVYWNVSTWNPYQVVMIETELRGHPVGAPQSP